MRNNSAAKRNFPLRGGLTGLAVGLLTTAGMARHSVLIGTANPGANFLLVPLQLLHNAGMVGADCCDNDASPITVELYKKHLSSFSFVARVNTRSTGGQIGLVPGLLVAAGSRAYKSKGMMKGCAAAPQQYLYGAVAHYQVNQPDRCR